MLLSFSNQVQLAVRHIGEIKGTPLREAIGYYRECGHTTQNLSNILSNAMCNSCNTFNSAT